MKKELLISKTGFIISANFDSGYRSIHLKLLIHKIGNVLVKNLTFDIVECCLVSW